MRRIPVAVVNPSASEILGLEGGVIDFAGWRFIDVSGEDRERFLHSQLVSDVRGLGPGKSQLSALLDARGRLRSAFFLCKRETSIELLVEASVAEDTAEALQSNVVADRVTIERNEERRLRLAIGPAAVELRAQLPQRDVFPIEAWGSVGFVTAGDQADRLQRLEARDIESLRVLSGLPRWGVEIEAGMLVSESTLYETAVSYDKGCFLGQETVAKIRSGRGPARFPTLLILEDGIEDADELVGEDLEIDDRKIGRVLSVAHWQEKTILQALLGRDQRVEGTHLRCETVDGIVISATVEPVPWISDWDASACARELHNRASELFVSGNEER
ncbi:MAG: hypothetical protein GY906_01500, partial [bacterium]|nr:hypothetical protein [bacterium]